MRAIPWSTISLGSLLLISAYSKGGQDVQSPQPEKSKPPVKTEQRGRIVGMPVSSSNPLIVIRCANGMRSILDSLTKAKARCFRGANTTAFPVAS
jgi:hypothetical protein